ncbi:MAG TPA: S8 family serine peptidase [Acidimicrobiales bacterium]|nr:S8 family serine peptidase [Acidimicrobiales bacterium]
MSLAMPGAASAVPGSAAPPRGPGGPEAQQAAYHPDLVLVGFRPGTSAPGRAAAHAGEGGRVQNRFEHLDLDVVRVPPGEDPAVVSQRYARNPNVAYAHPNWEVRLLSEPNDTLFPQLWGLHNTGQFGGVGDDDRLLGNGTVDADIDAPEGWDTAFGAGNFPSSGGTRVGVLDTGIDRAHVDLLSKTKACATAIAAIGIVIEGTCSDDNLHGTHVAGTIAATANNSVGVAGVAPNAELAVFKALNGAGVGFYADVIKGIHWLHTTGGAKVISMSIGGPKDKALNAELAEASKAGVLLVAAAGNDGDSTANYPAYHPDVVSVAATDRNDKSAWFSNCNSDVEVAAPGVDIWSTTPGNTYATLDGTSMATPHASGVAAMIWWKNPTWSAAQVRNQLNSTADDLGSSGRDRCFGHGRVNLARALGATAAPLPAAEPGLIAGTVTDATSKAVIGGATVDCGPAGTATTGPSGGYAIASVPAGAHGCTASAVGYKPKTSPVTVNSGQTTTVNFPLQRQR